MDTIGNQSIPSQPEEHAEPAEGEAIPQEPLITETLSVLDFTGCKGAKRAKDAENQLYTVKQTWQTASSGKKFSGTVSSIEKKISSVLGLLQQMKI